MYGVDIDTDIVEKPIHEPHHASIDSLLLRFLSLLLHEFSNEVSYGRLLRLHENVVQIQIFLGNQDAVNIANVENKHPFLAAPVDHHLNLLNVAIRDVYWDIEVNEQIRLQADVADSEAPL